MKATMEETIQNLLNQLLTVVSKQIEKEEYKQQIQTKLVHPILELIYREVQPYLLLIFGAVIFLLLISLIMVVLQLFLYLRK
jgi:hypothetical protein